jgi:hypothetical protein
MSEQQRRQEQAAQQMKSFAAAFAQGIAKPVDRFGNEIKAGDKIMLRFGVDPVLDVVSITPVLDPRAEPGMIDIVCTVTFPLRVKSGVPYQMTSVVARRQEADVPNPSNNGGGSTLQFPGAAPKDTPDLDNPPV